MKLKNWRLCLSAIGVLFSQALTAQNYFIEQALLFSRQNAGGSSRIQAMGGAQVALGGDFSSALSNPAGLGIYNRNEFTITPAYTIQSSNGAYNTFALDNQNNLVQSSFGSSASSGNVSLPGLSIVFGAGKNTDQEPFYGGTFAITLNRINDFNGAQQYSGQNNGTSMVDYFLEASNGYTIDQFDPQLNPNSSRNGPGKGDNVNTQAYLGYNNYLIGPTSATGTAYFTDIIGNPFQKETINTSGAQNQWGISYGANFLDKIFLGASLGITSLRYQYDKTYSENFEGQKMNCNGCFNNFKLHEVRTTTGSGVNLTLGAIIKPIEFVQFGISYITSTAYQLTDTYKGSMSSSWNNFDYYNNGQKLLNNVSIDIDDPDPNRNTLDPVNYGLGTPGRLNIGTALFLPKKGFITADIELVNYANASTSSFSEQLYNLTWDATNDVNKVVSSRFQSVTNIRLGAEYRYNDFRFRGGYSMMGNPYVKKPTDRINYSLTNLASITGGIGYRKAKFFVDLALVYTQGDGYYLPYSVSFAPSPYYSYTNSTTKIMFTVGFPF
jgi:hypothetical protein